MKKMKKENITLKSSLFIAAAAALGVNNASAHVLDVTCFKDNETISRATVTNTGPSMPFSFSDTNVKEMPTETSVNRETHTTTTTPATLTAGFNGWVYEHPVDAKRVRLTGAVSCSSFVDASETETTAAAMNLSIMTSYDQTVMRRLGDYVFTFHLLPDPTKTTN